MGNEGKIKDLLKSDAKGILSLYEATHLGVHGDEILDEVLAFTAAQLESLLPQLKHPLSGQVSHALKQSTHRGLPRLEGSYYFPLYQQDASHNEILLRFAKLDFNLLQKLHRQELVVITRYSFTLFYRISHWILIFSLCLLLAFLLSRCLCC